MSSRKQHNQDAGYIAERTNPFVPGKKIVIYVATEQNLDTWGDKYAIVCDAHGNIGSTTNIPAARKLMKEPNRFCLDCRAIAEARG
jgi:hypothetical protein